jgi:hypothetical protein
MVDENTIDFTEDGINYETREVEPPKVTYEFGEEGMKLLDSETHQVIGHISWRELLPGGGDTYYPSNIRISTTEDNEIVFGFDDSDVGEKAVRVSMVNGVPEVVVEEGGNIYSPNLTTERIEFRDSEGYSHGATIQTTEVGDIVFTVPHEGDIYNVSLISLIETVYGI